MRCVCWKLYFCYKGKVDKKKLTNVSLVCMYVGRKSEMSVFVFCFFPSRSNLSTISMVALEKKQKNVSFYGVCMYVRPKQTFVSFFLHPSLSVRLHTGWFFNCSHPKISKCQPVSKVRPKFKYWNCSHLEKNKERKKLKYLNCSHPINVE